MAREIARVPQTTIQVFKGRDKRITSTVLDKDSQKVDITGATIEFAMARKPDAKTPLVNLSTGAGITVTDAVNGAYRIDIADTDTENLSAGEYYFEVVLTDATGRESTVMHGIIEMPATMITT